MSSPRFDRRFNATDCDSAETCVRTIQATDAALLDGWYSLPETVRIPVRRTVRLAIQLLLGASMATAVPFAHHEAPSPGLSTHVGDPGLRLVAGSRRQLSSSKRASDAAHTTRRRGGVRR